MNPTLNFYSSRRRRHVIRLDHGFWSKMCKKSTHFIKKHEISRIFVFPLSRFQTLGPPLGRSTEHALGVANDPYGSSESRSFLVHTQTRKVGDKHERMNRPPDTKNRQKKVSFWYKKVPISWNLDFLIKDTHSRRQADRDFWLCSTGFGAKKYEFLVDFWWLLS